MTDNGPAYRSTIHAASCRRLGIRHLTTRPFRPRTNGKAERFIQTIVNGWAYARLYGSSSERSALLQPWLGRAAHPPRRLGRLRHPLEPRARAGDRAPGQGLLGVRAARHGLRPARRAEPRRARRDLPLDGADPVEPARGRALGARRDRRRLPLAADHDARGALQPDEAQPRRRARPRPHHPRRDPRPRPREPRVPAGARRPAADDGQDLHRRAERDHRREGDRLGPARDRRRRHRRPAPGRRALRLPPGRADGRGRT